MEPTGAAHTASRTDSVDLIIDGLDNEAATGNAVLELISGAQFQFLD